MYFIDKDVLSHFLVQHEDDRQYRKRNPKRRSRQHPAETFNRLTEKSERYGLNEGIAAAILFGELQTVPIQMADDLDRFFVSNCEELIEKYGENSLVFGKHRGASNFSHLIKYFSNYNGATPEHEEDQFSRNRICYAIMSCQQIVNLTNWSFISCEVLNMAIDMADERALSRLYRTTQWSEVIMREYIAGRRQPCCLELRKILDLIFSKREMIEIVCGSIMSFWPDMEWGNPIFSMGSAMPLKDMSR